MNVIVVSMPHNHYDHNLGPGLQRAFGQVAHYCRGRRLNDGPVHMAEVRLKRFAPQYLLQHSSFCLPTPAALMADVLDDLLGMVSRLEDPSQVKVEIIAVGQLQAGACVGSAGE